MNANQEFPVHIVVLGASGNLSTHKIFPGLFALFARGRLPKDVRFTGLARTAMRPSEFRAMLAPHLHCDDLPDATCGPEQAEFLRRCDYFTGAYDNPDTYAELRRRAAPPDAVHELWYLALPPSVFPDALRALGRAAPAHRPTDPWIRVVIEKPFGWDRESSDALTTTVQQVFDESQVFRIDHYLGKEAVQNLMVLRFANAIFEPIWNRKCIRHVHIAWKEDLSLEGRGGYFDAYGIVRDVMQNHLIQMLALIAMEPPATADAQCVRDEKVRILRQIPPLLPENMVLGQYGAARYQQRQMKAYREEDGIAPDSRTPTYAAVVLNIDNPRWHGVPFLLTAGKGLDQRMTEIRLHFNPVRTGPFVHDSQNPRENEFVIRVQPDENIYFRIVNKIPGPGMHLNTPKLDLAYRDAYRDRRIADAYENLLLDVLRGERGLFIRADELAAAWDIFTPALQAVEASDRRPDSYPFGSQGPASVREMARRFGIEDAFAGAHTGGSVH